MQNQPFRILLVEDCLGDIGLVRHVLRDHKQVELTVACDGEKALHLLFSPTVRIPDLILLDLNLPKRTGFEILEELRSSDALRTVPVAVLTSSAAERDVLAAYALGANCYVVKPIGFDEFHSAVTRTVAFWRTIAVRPMRGSCSYAAC